MAHSCSQCSFTAQFESALRMHHQLHHEASTLTGFQDSGQHKKANTVPRVAKIVAALPDSNQEKDYRLPNRTSSATRIFEKLRSSFVRTRSKILFSHPEESTGSTLTNTLVKDLTSTSGCTKVSNMDCLPKTSTVGSAGEAVKEAYGCHLCSFDADRITVLDRHLLNDHKISLDALLKLVMVKTKEGLNEDGCANAYGIRQPYYKLSCEVVEDGEFVIETVTPRIKILKHASTNTDIQWADIPDLKDNCRKISKELEKLMRSSDKYDKGDLFAKMQILSDCMRKFIDSSNTLKKVLTKEFDSASVSTKEFKSSVRERPSTEPLFDLGLGDQESPRDWERAHSERTERSRRKHADSARPGVPKMSSDSFYF